MRPMPELTVEEVPTRSLVPYANNAKTHSAQQVGQIASSIEEFGFNDPVGVWQNQKGELEIVEGHGRVLAAERLGIETIPIFRLDHLTDEQRRAYTHVHNQTTLTSGFDLEVLDLEMEELDFDWEEFGFDMVDITTESAIEEEDRSGNLAKKFGFVPFSVINAASAAWQERKKDWISLGIRSELGRGEGLAYIPGLMGKSKQYRQKQGR